MVALALGFAALLQQWEPAPPGWTPALRPPPPPNPDLMFSRPGNGRDALFTFTGLRGAGGEKRLPHPTPAPPGIGGSISCSGSGLG